MGRWFSGDIEGKFMVAVQASNDADFFGVEGIRPEELNYHFSESDLDGVSKGIDTCIYELGRYFVEIEEFFAEHDFYSDDDLAKSIRVTEVKVKILLVWYARLKLGLKIKKSILDVGQCDFDAEI